MPNKVALITGITGQDGSYLAELLLSKGYEVHGLLRRVSSYPLNLKNIEHIKERIIFEMGDLENESHICGILNRLKPDELYNLAAQSDVRLSFDVPEYTGNATGISVTRILEAVRHFSPKTKLYQAGSSEMFGTAAPPQNENGPFNPQNPYAVAKLYGFHMVRIYRRAYNIFASSGILFNHESPRRGLNFVTRKITNASARIYCGLQEKLNLGNLMAKRDWGYAPEYVEAMWLMLQQDRPDDFVIGTGETHTVKEFVEAALEYVGLDMRCVGLDENSLRPTETNYLQADNRKALTELGWKPKTYFKDLVKIMVDHDMSLVAKEINGKVGVK